MHSFQYGTSSFWFQCWFYTFQVSSTVQAVSGSSVDSIHFIVSSTVPPVLRFQCGFYTFQVSSRVEAVLSFTFLLIVNKVQNFNPFMSFIGTPGNGINTINLHKNLQFYNLKK